MSDDVMVHPLPVLEWGAATRAMFGYSYRQVWAYSTEIAELWSADAEMIGVADGPKSYVGAASVRIRRLPAQLGGVAYVSGGPLLRSNSSKSELEYVLRALIDEFVIKRKFVLRIAPPVEWVLAGLPVDDILFAMGFRYAPRSAPYTTLVLDIRQSESQLEKALHPKWRTSLRRSQDSDLRVRHSRSEEAMAEFSGLHDELMIRKGFDVELTSDFYKRVVAKIAPADNFDITLADLNGHTLAGHVGSSLGTTCVYILGASTPAGNSVGASFALQWSAISRARLSGMNWYDLGGINPANNPGVYRFKKRMNGIEVIVPGPYEIGPGACREGIVRLGEATYRRIRRSSQRIVTQIR